MKSNAMNQILEGVVGHLTNNQLSYPQSLTFWLRAMKEAVNFNGRFIEDDHVLGVLAGADGTTGNGTGNIKDTASWVYGMLATSIDAQANVALLVNDKSFNPATTALDYHGVLYLPTAAATTPTAAGLVWFPNEYMDTCIQVNATYHSDYGTTAVASTVNIWVPYRNQ